MKRKETSTNFLNEQQIHACCAAAHALSLIAGRWKLLILWRLFAGQQRFTELKNSMEGISEKILGKQLRQLEAARLIERTIYPEVPPRVEYALTEKGRSLEPVLRLLASWGQQHLEIPSRPTIHNGVLPATR